MMCAIYMCCMRIEEYSWLSLGFFFVFFVHVGVGYMFGHEMDTKPITEETNSTAIFKNIKIKKVVV